MPDAETRSAQRKRWKTNRAFHAARLFVVMALPAEDEERRRITVFEVLEITEGESIPETQSMMAWHAGIYAGPNAAFDRCRREAENSNRKAHAKNYFLSENAANRRTMSRRALVALFDELADD
jgi:hypothetical protein